MGAKTGRQMFLYRNSGSHGTPVWDEICNVGDVNVSDFSRGLAELKRRCSQYIKNLPALIQSITVEFSMIHGVNPTTFNAMFDDFINGTPVEYAIMDGDITLDGTQGLMLPALVQKFPWNQPLEDVSAHDVGLAIAYMEDGGGNEIDPEWLVISD